MAHHKTVSYSRAPSKELHELLLPGESLAPLIALNNQKQRFGDTETELDVHFGVDDKIHVYCGRTAILTVKRLQQPRGYLKADASPRYKEKQPRAKATGLFGGRWRIGDDGFIKAFKAYLDVVDVNLSFIEGEGAVQSLWARATDPWVPFDREGELKGSRAMRTDFPKVRKAFDELTKFAQSKSWESPKLKGVKIDQLAVDSKGQLVLLELKDGSKSNSEVYYAPFQLLQYVWEWHDVLEHVRDDLQKLIDARMAVGLTPRGAPRLTGGIRASVCFGHDTPSGDTETYYKKVLGIVNRHLPHGVECIETWQYGDNGPRQMA